MSDKKKIIIIGGVAGGASCAARARRLSEDAEIILVERGPHVSFANCGLPYHIEGTIAERDNLLIQTPESLKRRFQMDVRVQTEALRIDRANKQVLLRDLAGGREYTEPYDALVLSPGAEPIRPPLPGFDNPLVRTLRNLADMDTIQDLLQMAKSKSVVVVGGGYIGLEMTEALAARGFQVTLVELAGQVMSPVDPEMATPLHDEIRRHGVDLRLGASVTAFEETDGGLNARLSTGETIACGLAILAIGVKPDARLAREAGLETGALGGISVDARMRTSDPDIFAVGDAIETKEFVTGAPALLPLAGPANRQGRIAADAIFGRESKWRGTQGTAICKVFDTAIGITGLSEKALKRLGRPYEKIYVHPSSHASYYPCARQINFKLLFEPQSGKVLGAQAVGADGVDKRIDVIAMAVQAGLTVFDLEEAELSYAPPYGSAKDVVNYAGFVAANALRGETKLCHSADMDSPRDDQFLLDVRTPAEVAAGTIPGALNIPVDSLRARLKELPAGKEILVFCRVGLRGHIACRILSQHGFPCRNLTGGYITWQMSKTAVTRKPDGPSKGSSGEKTGPAEPPDSPASGGTTGAAGSVGCGGAPSCCGGPVLKVDARGLQCPGPIVKLKEAIDSAAAGQKIEILVSDAAFCNDLPAWCEATGNILLGVEKTPGGHRAVVVKSETAAPLCAPQPAGAKNMTIVVFSGDFDKVMAAFVIANGALAMGMQPTLFFTFWGINALRRAQPVAANKNLIEKMFGWMMPRGANKLALSRMNMAGMGLAMIKDIMRKKNVSSLPQLIADARRAGARLVACTMSMDLMGIKREELIDGIEEGGVGMYLGAAAKGTVNLFV